MGAYTIIAGWIEIPESVRPNVEQIINSYASKGPAFGLTSDQAELYVSAWMTQKQSVNGALFAFYGAQIRTSAREFLKSLIKEIADLEEVNADDDFVLRPEGYFLLEEDGTHGLSPIVWDVREGNVSEREKDIP